jgi:enoyl-CoA hydratase/carnithine racemase
LRCACRATASTDCRWISSWFSLAATIAAWKSRSAVYGYQEVLDDPQVKENGSLLTGKLNLRAAHSMTLENSIQYERDLQTVTFATADAQEGIASFKEKRPPNFEGR